MSEALRLPVRVRPGSARPGVKGDHAGSLVVAVSERAVDGRATEAALVAVAQAFGVRRRNVRLVTGRTSRSKIVEIEGDVARLRGVCDALLRPD